MARRWRGLGLRAWLALVAAVALAMGAERIRARRVYCQERAAEHRDSWGQGVDRAGLDPAGLDREGRLVGIDLHAARHLAAAWRFAGAADRPWNPVPPEPGMDCFLMGVTHISLGGFDPSPGGDPDR